MTLTDVHELAATIGVTLCADCSDPITDDDPHDECNDPDESDPT